MLEELQRLFRESMEAFRAERNRRDPEDQVAELLGAMRRELVAARAALPEYREALDRARAELARERSQLEQTRRRGEMAARIGDDETVRVAEEWAGRYTGRIAVLEQKVSAQEAELELRTREAEEMKRRYQEADSNRFLLLSELKRGAMRERVHGIGERLGRSEDDWARMAEKIHSTQGYADALEELEDEPDPPPGGGAVDMEERLRELKRRMGKE